MANGKGVEIRGTANRLRVTNKHTGETYIIQVNGWDVHYPPIPDITMPPRGQLIPFRTRHTDPVTFHLHGEVKSIHMGPRKKKTNARS